MVNGQQLQCKSLPRGNGKILRIANHLSLQKITNLSIQRMLHSPAQITRSQNPSLKDLSGANQQGLVAEQQPITSSVQPGFFLNTPTKIRLQIQNQRYVLNSPIVSWGILLSKRGFLGKRGL